MEDKSINAGKVGLTMGGDWKSSESYEKLTCVSHNGRSWAAKKNVSAGVEPSEANSAFWQLMSDRGMQGIQGPVGPQGNSAFDGTGVEIVNNLTQGGQSAVLSAEQGKVLKTELTELESEIGKIQPIINQGTINNAADEEDLTSENNLLKLKDRSALNGMGYVILRKNKSFVSQVSLPNTIYEIRYEFDLYGTEVEMPSSCILKFEGGKLSNGVIVGNETRIDAAENVSIFGIDVLLNGTWTNDDAFVKWFSAKDDCVLADDAFVSGTNNLFPFLNLLKFNNIKVGGGTYYVEFSATHRSLFLRSNQIIDGQGARIKFKYYNKYVSAIEIGGKDNPVNNAVIKNLDIVGWRQEGTDVTEFAHGIFITNGDGNIVENMTISHFRGDGIYVGGATEYIAQNEFTDYCPTNTTIRKCRCVHNHRQGVSLTHCDGVLVVDSEFLYTEGTAPQAGIDIEPNPVKDSDGNVVERETANNISIHNCVIAGNKGAAIAMLAEWDSPRITNIHILDCNITSESTDAVVLHHAIKGCVIQGNKISTLANAIVLNHQCYDIIIDDNIIDGNDAAVIGIALYSNGENWRISNNQIFGFARYGLFKPNTKHISYVSVIGNRISSNYNNALIDGNADNVFYADNRSYLLGYKKDGVTRYDGWTWGHLFTKLDDFASRKDTDAMINSGSGPLSEFPSTAKDGFLYYDITNHRFVYKKNDTITELKDVGNEKFEDVLILYHSNNGAALISPEKWNTLANPYAVGVVVKVHNELYVIAPETTQKAWGVSAEVKPAVKSLQTLMTSYTGKEDTSEIVTKQSQNAEYAAGYCYNYARMNADNKGIPANFWWLPSVAELMEIFLQKDKINYAMSLIGGMPLADDAVYFTTNEYYAVAYTINAINKSIQYANKATVCSVLPISKLEYASPIDVR